MRKEIPLGHWSLVAPNAQDEADRQAEERRKMMMSKMPASTAVVSEARVVPHPSPQGTPATYDDLVEASANLVLFVRWLARFSQDVHERVRIKETWSCPVSVDGMALGFQAAC